MQMHSIDSHRSHPEIIKRLKRAIGQLNSIVAMMESGRPCGEVAQQLQAAEKAIMQAKKTFIHDHIDQSLDGGVFKGPKAALDEFKAISKYL
jgi:DNA-binding FrmR family transcriptional regulator